MCYTYLNTRPLAPHALSRRARARAFPLPLSLSLSLSRQAEDTEYVSPYYYLCVLILEYV